MLDHDILSQLRSQPLDVLVQTLERLHRTRAEGELPVELRAKAPAQSAAPTPPLVNWLASIAPSVARRPPDAAAESSPLPREPAAATDAGVENVDLASTIRSVLSEYEGLLRRYNEDFDRLFERTSAAAADPANVPLDASLESMADLVARLRRAQLLFLKFPIAAQAAFAAFVEEGRRYGKTAEGERWKHALVGSPLLKEVRGILSSLSMAALRENPSTVLPSSIVDLLVSAASRGGDIDELVAKAFRPRPEP
jgi:hypothetical protein